MSRSVAAIPAKWEIAESLATLPDGRRMNVVMFEHGTVVFVTTRDEDRIIGVARRVHEQIGQGGGAGSCFGDFRVLKVKGFRGKLADRPPSGWLVEFCWGPTVVAIVQGDDVGTSSAAPALIGLVGRNNRDLDMLERKIVYRSWSEAEADAIAREKAR